MATDIRNHPTSSNANGIIFWVVLALIVLAGLGYASYRSQYPAPMKVVGAPATTTNASDSTNTEAPAPGNIMQNSESDISGAGSNTAATTVAPVDSPNSPSGVNMPSSANTP